MYIKQRKKTRVNDARGERSGSSKRITFSLEIKGVRIIVLDPFICTALIFFSVVTPWKFPTYMRENLCSQMRLCECTLH